MELTRRNLLVYGLLAAGWALVVLWQVEEHARVRHAARNDLRNRSTDIANTVGAFVRGLRFRGGMVAQDRLESVLNELVGGTNVPVKSSELTSIELLNATNFPVASAGQTNDPAEFKDILREGERWGRQSVMLVVKVDLGTNTVVVPPRTNGGFGGPRGGGPRREPPPEPTDLPEPSASNVLAAAASAAGSTNVPPDERMGPPPPREGDFRRGRPPRMRMDEQAYQALRESRGLHTLVLAMSTDSLQAASLRDLWLRAIIILLTTISVVGSGLAWRNLARTSELQIRLVRASEMNTHLKEMNLAAAGLAHETRNPLNIIRGLAQMISKRPDTGTEVRQKSREIIDEADKVAAQLNEFINYSRPREVRRTRLALGSVVNEVVRTLNYDLDEKKIHLEVKGEQLSIEADEQMLRQALFNLILNAIQAVNGNGEIQVLAERRNNAEGSLEVRDNGPGVPIERRAEIFKPYFTTQKTGTGLGLAVVQQIVQAHGWEIQCLANEPQGAIFRISHLRLAV
jgi:signal transduction histidine kinase